MSYVKHTEINFWHLPPPKLIVQIPRTVLLNEAYKQADRGTYRIHIPIYVYLFLPVHVPLPYKLETRATILNYAEAKLCDKMVVL